MGLKKFFKKNLRDIATVVGFAVGGPAGAAIGQGIGSVGEGRSLQDSLMSAAKVYGGANIASGAGLQGGGGSISFGPGGIAQGVATNSVPGFFQGLGAAGRAGSLAGIGEAFGSLSGLQKLGVLGTGAAMLGGMGEEQGTASMPAAAGGQYLTQGLRPATVSDVYGTASGLPSASTALASAMPGAVDPITQTYLQMLTGQDQDYGQLAFPEFSQQPLMAKDGGIARLADGGAMPEVDLRNSGGGLSDPEGSGDEDTIPALLADGEFVMTKQAVKGIGNGDHNRGIEALYAMMDFNENKAQNMGLGRA
jgi:hypothetical protein